MGTNRIEKINHDGHGEAKGHKNHVEFPAITVSISTDLKMNSKTYEIWFIAVGM